MVLPQATRSKFDELWRLDPEVTLLNHGSFGACPVHVLEYQDKLRAELEAEPVRFFVERFEPMLDDARAALGEFLGADPEDLAFVPNATVGVNSVLRSLDFQPDDELLTTNHEYNACRNVLNFVAERTGARIVIAEIPFPILDPSQIINELTSRVTSRTKLAMISHVTSPTALIFPIVQVVRELADRAVDTLVDGAHGPGMVDLNLQDINAAYYAGNCHKWMCAPKGAGFLHVRRDRQHLIHPAVISHGRNSPRTDRSRFRLEFDWTGTADPTPSICVPQAIRYMDSLLPGGWPELRRRNRELVLHARRLVCDALGRAIPAPDEMIGAMASIPLPDARTTSAPVSSLYADPLQLEVIRRHRIQVPFVPWPAHPRRLIRLSAQLYNDLEEYQRLVEALFDVLAPDLKRP